MNNEPNIRASRRQLWRYNLQTLHYGRQNLNRTLNGIYTNNLVIFNVVHISSICAVYSVCHTIPVPNFQLHAKTWQGAISHQMMQLFFFPLNQRFDCGFSGFANNSLHSEICYKAKGNFCVSGRHYFWSSGAQWTVHNSPSINHIFPAAPRLCYWGFALCFLQQMSGIIWVYCLSPRSCLHFHSSPLLQFLNDISDSGDCDLQTVNVFFFNPFFVEISYPQDPIAAALRTLW